ncbi:MAG: FtsX-like permease family protein [bacterium]|nr:FtsX-like permease family protein [bacterium]
MRKFFNLAYKNLYRRKIRSMLTIGGVGVAVAVLVSLLGFNSGYRIALEKDVSGMGYQVLITAKGCPYELATVALSGTGALRYLTDDTIAKVKQDKEIAELTPMLMNPLIKENGNGFYTFWGIDKDSYTKLRPMMQIAKGKHKERITDPSSGKETEKEIDGPMGRWFKTREIKADEIYLKNGKVLKGLITGEGKYEKVVGTELDPVSGDFVQKKKMVSTVKVMLPSRVYNKIDVESVKTAKIGEELKDELYLKDGSKITGVILNETKDVYNVGDVELAYPNSEEIDLEQVAVEANGSPKIIKYDKGEEIELVMGWEAAQTGFVQVGQKLAINVKEMAREKVKEKITDPVSGKSKEIEKEIEKPVSTSYTFRVVGILEKGGGQDDGSYFIQIEEAQRIFRKYKMLTGIGVRLNNLAQLPLFTDRIYNRKELGETQIVSLAEVKGTILNLVQTAKILVMSVAFIAILVALIGVMNTILMSVFERTQEIGIMKAIGASRMDIFKLIWLETIVICVFGGILGTIIAVVGGSFIEKLIRAVMSRAGYVPAGQIINFTPGIIIGSFVGAIVLGILSGIWPAYRAAKMRPIEAIRSGE